MRPDFRACEKVATDLILASAISELPFDISALNFKQNIIFDSMQNYCRLTNTELHKLQTGSNKDGCIVVIEDLYLVLYNEDSSSLERMNWTNLHEIGHALREHKSDGNIEEVEAHFVAACLCMPDAVIRELITRGVSITEESLIRIFNVSQEAAERKMRTITRMGWRPLHKIYRGRELVDQFTAFIDRVTEEHETAYFMGFYKNAFY